MSIWIWLSGLFAILTVVATIFTVFGIAPRKDFPIWYRKLRNLWVKPLPINPFGKRGRLDTPDSFYRRESLLRRIYDELRKGQSVVLLGDEQMGKSSLLSYVAREGKKELPQYTFVYLDLNTIRNDSDFFTALCDKLQLPVDKIPQCRGHELHKHLKNKKYVLCLDEIGRLTCDKFDREMRDELRGLAEGEQAPLRLLIASHKPLQEVFTDSSQYQSPLANICTVIRIEPFSLDEVTGLIQQYLREQKIQFSETEIADIFEHSQGQPFNVQQQASALYQQKMPH